MVNDLKMVSSLRSCLTYEHLETTPDLDPSFVCSEIKFKLTGMRQQGIFLIYVYVYFTYCSTTKHRENTAEKRAHAKYRACLQEQEFDRVLAQDKQKVVQL